MPIYPLYISYISRMDHIISIMREGPRVPGPGPLGPRAGCGPGSLAAGPGPKGPGSWAHGARGTHGTHGAHGPMDSERIPFRVHWPSMGPMGPMVFFQANSVKIMTPETKGLTPFPAKCPSPPIYPISPYPLYTGYRRDAPALAPYF